MEREEEMKISIITLFVLITPAVYPAPLTAAEAAVGVEPDSCLVERKECVVRAIRTTNGGIKIDGILGESAWKHTPATTGFIQHEPHDGIPATEKTDVRIVYDDYAIYVGVRAYDKEPHLIEGRLTRSDNECPSDWIHVAIDSYNDNRTAFEFAVNPLGVKLDAM